MEAKKRCLCFVSGFSKLTERPKGRLPMFRFWHFKTYTERPKGRLPMFRFFNFKTKTLASRTMEQQIEEK